MRPTDRWLIRIWRLQERCCKPYRSSRKLLKAYRRQGNLCQNPCLQNNENIIIVKSPPVLCLCGTCPRKGLLNANIKPCLPDNLLAWRVGKCRLPFRWGRYLGNWAEICQDYLRNITYGLFAELEFVFEFVYNEIIVFIVIPACYSLQLGSSQGGKVLEGIVYLVQEAEILQGQVLVVGSTALGCEKPSSKA